MLSILAFNLVLALLFGAAVGLERESGQPREGSAGGMRTYALIALLGSVCGILYVNNLAVLAIAVTVCFFIMILVYYGIGSLRTGDYGMTTEVATFFTFLIGMLPMLNIIPTQMIVAIFVVLVMILSIKAKTKELVAGVSSKEIQSFINYAIISLVILPFLPNIGYSLHSIPVVVKILENMGVILGPFMDIEIINPQKLWFVVVLITGIDVFGYALGRIIGNKSSFTVASFLGGFVSSTSTTQSLALRSKKTHTVNYLIGAALLSNMASFMQVFLLAGPLNGKWLITLLPSLFIMIGTSGMLALYFLKKHEPEKQEEERGIKDFKIFSLESAFKFAVLITTVKLLTKVCLILFGKSGFIISSIIASFVGMDAIIITLAEMAGVAFTFKFAVLTFLLVNATNLISKMVYSYIQGSRNFAFRFIAAISVVAIASFAGLLFIPV
jgi:uncharacterized membrane protein (DUF4010 family)